MHYRTIQCREVTCGVKFTTASPQTKYCSECRREVAREQTQDSNNRRGNNHAKPPLFVQKKPTGLERGWGKVK